MISVSYATIGLLESAVMVRVDHVRGKVEICKSRNTHLLRAVITTFRREAMHGFPKAPTHQPDRVTVLRFFAPGKQGRSQWEYFGESVFGKELFRVLFLYTGPMVLIEPETGQAREYQALQLPALSGDIDQLLTNYVPDA